jgi:serine/threonine protein kinase
MNPTLKRIGNGKISVLYTDGVYAYKTYPSDYPITWIQYEMDTHLTILNHTKLPMVQYYELKDRQIRMSWIQGITLAQRMLQEKYTQALADLVQLQASIYQYSVPGLANAHDLFKQQIESSKLSEKLKLKALTSLNNIEPNTTLLHLDFHPENILFDGKSYTIIDWVNAKAGNPVMDIARTYVIFKQYLSRQANKYVKMICKTIEIDPKDVYQAVPLMAFLRILENDADSFRTTLESLIQEVPHV